MSADREPTAVEVIAEALIDARCHPDCWLTTSNGHPACSDCSAAAALTALKAAGFVVATRRQIRVREGDAWDNALTEMRDLGWMHDGALVDGLARNPYRDVQP